MKGRSAIRGCGRKRKKKKVCGLVSLPDDVFVDCLVQLSRLDLVAITMVSRRHRYIAGSRKLWTMRYRMDSVEPYVYVLMHMYPDPSPRWFVFHPVQRRLKRVHPPSLCPAPAPLEGSCFVTTESGIYTIGGLMDDGKPTSEVTFLNCIDHKVCRVAPMNVARSRASASLIEDGKKKKIYVFGGCWDVADSSNWVEVYDFETRTWGLLSVSTPKMPLRIKESMAMDEKHVYAVDEDGEIFFFSASECRFWAAGGAKESDPDNKNDWRLFDQTFFCRGVGGRILWRSLTELGWKEVKGLEELQQQQHIIKIFAFSGDRMAIFWSQGPAYQTLELWFAEVSLTDRWQGEEWEVWGNIEWSAEDFTGRRETSNEDNLNPRVRHYYERGNGLDDLFEFDDTNIMKDEEMQTEADMFTKCTTIRVAAEVCKEEERESEVCAQWKEPKFEQLHKKMEETNKAWLLSNQISLRWNIKLVLDFFKMDFTSRDGVKGITLGEFA
ncbi:hypothetical protein DY000_02010908 [Brassica cretica]|uniref:F-box domain-containing protein n=1 Tax=Brassica cretica TaxID=69181 RepID=A0ABQ7CUJ8_BRACR|nr:hypothetical protein DY000_02010908 [Brassica cretica]